MAPQGFAQKDYKLADGRLWHRYQISGPDPALKEGAGYDFRNEQCEAGHVLAPLAKALSWPSFP